MQPSTGPTAAAPRLHALDSLRACMMLLVIWFHASCSYATVRTPDWPFKDTHTSAFLTVFLLFIHVFSMPVFFVLAGFFARLMWQRRGASVFLRNRAERILVPFVVTLPLLYAWDRYYLGSHTGIRTMHLWFLYYLIYLYPAAVLTGWLVRRFVPVLWQERIESGFRRLLTSAWRPVFFAIPTCIPLFFMQRGTLDVNITFLVQPRNMAIYAIFFAFGWLLYGQSDLLTGFQRAAWTQVLIAVALAPVNFLSLGKLLRALPVEDLRARVSVVATESLMMWLLIFGITGLFLRYLDRPSARMQYLSDASYWMYLVHLPLVVWAQRLVGPLAVPGIVKFTLVLAICFPILLASYQLLVRYTLIGRVLNGPRERELRSGGAQGNQKTKAAVV